VVVVDARLNAEGTMAVGSSTQRTDLPLTVTTAAERLRAGELTSVELTSAFLARADVLDPQTGTYVTRLDESALAQAAAADDDFARGVDRGLYQGIPIGIKDILAVAEGPTTANSLVLDRAWGAGKDAPVVQRLKDAGAVITGKTTTNEFAIGSPDPSKPFPIPNNPWNLARSPGGSSAGTGNGIAAGLFLAGIGTDTGGSIRLPAAWNGTSGLMPTYGRVPKSGCVPLGYSLDHIGPLARSARDCAAMLALIAGYHASDESCVDRPVDDYTGKLTGDLTGLRIGVERANHFPPEADPAVAGCFDAAIATLAELGAELIEVRLPWYAEVTTALSVMMSGEALAYHRNDMTERWEDYGALTRINIGRGALGSAADYVQAARVRRVAQQEVGRLFDRVDLIVGPTVAVGALPHQALSEPKELGRLFRTLFTGYWDAVGNPALVVPMGFTGDGLPLSLQLAARPFDEATALRAGDAYQRQTDWHLRPSSLLADLLAA
jgi:aspartyl-tRNA(Asn)/glutamyl-tRNA(Gln) amidotransferase subunit A